MKEYIKRLKDATAKVELQKGKNAKAIRFLNQAERKVSDVESLLYKAKDEAESDADKHDIEFALGAVSPLEGAISDAIRNIR